MASSTLRVHTPPPPTRIRTPTTPRLGTFNDDYQPYSPRKSSRISERARANNNSPPATPGRKIRAIPSSPKSAKRSSTSTSNLPTSPQTATKKRFAKSPSEMGGRRVSGALNFDTTASAAASLGLQTPHRTDKMKKSDIPRPVAAIRGNGMLPTPDKTPSRRAEKTDPAVSSVARTLFSVSSATAEEAMPTPKKKGKKYKGFTLDSFETEDEPIAIFTDSHERVPEPDDHSDNPFFGEGAKAVPEPTKPSTKRRKITVPGEGEFDYAEVEKRTDGYIAVFRGKKVFRKFSNSNAESSRSSRSSRHDHVPIEDRMVDDEVPSPPPTGRVTRSSMNPRLLFPSAQQLRAKQLSQQEAEDEEADTDIEDPSIIGSPSKSIRHSSSSKIAITPADKDEVTTPQTPRSPGVTPRATRRHVKGKAVDLGSSPGGPITSDDEMDISPFQSWQKKKGHNKREASPIPRGRKKLRN
ncbi:hypothetical protein B0J14DRAFT_327887 [Halenospora varia]|nr:hypothetical protein B0J14DRAFT_327887 [Halenospora varia]